MPSVSDGIILRHSELGPYLKHSSLGSARFLRLCSVCARVEQALVGFRLIIWRDM